MNKTKLLYIALCAIALTGCVESERIDSTPKDNDRNISRKYFDGHYYITCFVGRGGGITHDPDCPCREKGGDNERD